MKTIIKTYLSKPTGIISVVCFATLITLVILAGVFGNIFKDNPDIDLTVFINIVSTLAVFIAIPAVITTIIRSIQVWQLACDNKIQPQQNKRAK